MQTTVEIPEFTYQKSAEVARKTGFTVEELMAQVLEREVAPEVSATPPICQKASFPYHSLQDPRHVGLIQFRFDDLLS